MKLSKELKIQLVKFVLIGTLATLTDLGCYYMFLNIFPEKILSLISNEAVSKTLSFICGILVTYNFNKYWTWKQKDRSNKRFIKFSILYGCSLVLNVTINSGFLYLLHHKEFFTDLPYKYFIAFVFATGFSSIFNFIGQKKWVFLIKD